MQVVTATVTTIRMQAEKESSMEEVVKFLGENPVQYLATVGRDGKAKCRPFMFLFEEGGKLWFSTGNFKDVYKDMQENPNIEICVASSDFVWVRINGTVSFTDDAAIKARAIENPIVKGNYETADNPTLEVFCLEGATATLADFSGNPPRTYEL